MARSTITPEQRFEMLQIHAAKRGKEVTLTLENMRLLMAETHCQYTGVPFDDSENAVFSIERIDNHIGYAPGNVVPVTIVANNIKGDYPLVALPHQVKQTASRRAGPVKQNQQRVDVSKKKLENIENQLAILTASRDRAIEVLAKAEKDLESSKLNVEEDVKKSLVLAQINKAIQDNPNMAMKYLTTRQKLKFMVANFSPKQFFAKLKVKIKH